MTNKEKYPNVDDVRRAAKDEAKAKPDEPKIEKPSDNDELTGIECPICHGKNGHILSGVLGSLFKCLECNALIDKQDDRIGMSVEDFKSFIADLCKKNKKKD